MYHDRDLEADQDLENHWAIMQLPQWVQYAADVMDDLSLSKKTDGRTTEKKKNSPHVQAVAAVGAEPIVYLLSEGLKLTLQQTNNVQAKAAENHLQLQRDITEGLEICHEKLYESHWADVPHIWRVLYSAACLLAALCQVIKALAGRHNIASVDQKDGKQQIDDCKQELLQQQQQLFRKALEFCDKGLLMGAPLLNQANPRLLSRFASEIHKELDDTTTTTISTLDSAKRKRIDEREEGGERNLKTATRGQTRLDAPSVRAKFCASYCDLHVDPVSILQCPSLLTFQQNNMARSTPVVITGGMEHWPASIKWTSFGFDYLKEVAGNRTVPVELGSSYTSDAWSQKLMTLREFIDLHILNPAEGPRGYLAQHTLFDQIPELKKDIVVPDYCCLGDGELREINAWIGPEGTVSPLHHDPHHNLLSQVVGQKYIRLFPQSESVHVYPHQEKLLFNTSQVDIENPDIEKFPDFVKAQSYECVLNAGEMLYIPPLYWHFVRSLSPSISVSFWWT